MIAPKITFGGVAALAAVIMVAAIIFLVEQRAADRALEDVERQNNAAGSQSDSARRAFDLCFDGGGVWNYAAGECDRPANGGRD